LRTRVDSKGASTEGKGGSVGGGGGGGEAEGGAEAQARKKGLVRKRGEAIKTRLRLSALKMNLDSERAVVRQRRESERSSAGTARTSTTSSIHRNEHCQPRFAGERAGLASLLRSVVSIGRKKIFKVPCAFEYLQILDYHPANCFHPSSSMLR